MGHDTVDDLHHAEDALGVLLAALESVLEGAGSIDAAEKVRQAVAVGRAYCRCGEWDPILGYDCDSDCGCPGTHSHAHP